MANIETKELILIATFIFLLAPLFLLFYVSLYNQRKKKHKEETAMLESAYRQELLKAQIEVQEQTLNNISREIHDNINQVLSFVKLNLLINANTSEQQKQQKITESRNLVAQVINDLRDLSKSLSFEHISQQGLLKTIEQEADRINKSGLVRIDLTVEGDAYALDEQHELVLFRIFQEAVNNALKHAGAKGIKIHLQYLVGLFNLNIQDDGVGFSSETLQMGGSGLRNMGNRATLIGATMQIDSLPGNGCSINVSIDPLTQHTHVH